MGVYRTGSKSINTNIFFGRKFPFFSSLQGVEHCSSYNCVKLTYLESLAASLSSTPIALPTAASMSSLTLQTSTPGGDTPSCLEIHLRSVKALSCPTYWQNEISPFTKKMRQTVTIHLELIIGISSNIF